MTNENVAFVKSRDRNSFLSLVRKVSDKKNYGEVMSLLESVVFRNELREEAIYTPVSTAGRHITWENTLSHDATTGTSPKLDNAIPLLGELAATGSWHDLIQLNASDAVVVGDTAAVSRILGTYSYLDATSGIRIKNNVAIAGEIAAGGTWRTLLTIDASNYLKVGSDVLLAANLFGNSNVTTTISGSTIGMAASGGVVLSSGTDAKLTAGSIYLNTNNRYLYGYYASSLQLIGVDTTPRIVVGDAATVLRLYGSQGASHLIQMDNGGTKLNGATVLIDSDIQLSTNNTVIKGRNAADSAYIEMMKLDGSDNLWLGGATALTVLDAGTAVRVSGCPLRMENNQRIEYLNLAGSAWKNAITLNASNQIVIGESDGSLGITYLYGSTSGVYISIAGNHNAVGGNLITDNEKGFYSKDTGGTARGCARLNSSNKCILGNPTYDTLISGTYIRYQTVHYDDLRVSANAVRIPGSAAPSWSTFQGSIEALEFATAPPSNASVYFSVQLPHTYKEGTNITPHVHWSPNGTNTGNVRWGLEYTWVNVDGTFPAPTTIYINDAGSGTQYDHQVAIFAEITGTSKDISSMLMCRLFRDTDDAADTLTDGAFLLEFDIHHQVDAPGSEAITSKA